MKTHFVRTLFVVSTLLTIAMIVRNNGRSLVHTDSAVTKVTSSAHASMVSPAIQVAETPAQTPAWAVPFGKEFWRRPSNPAPAPTKSGAPDLPPSINLGDIMDRVTFAFRDENKTLSVNGPTYRAEAAPSGIRFTPFRPDETREDALPFNDGVTAILHTKQIRASGATIVPAAPNQSERVVAGNTVQRLLNPAGFIEHFESTEQGLAISWIIPQKPAAGDLTVDFEVNGLTYLDRTDKGHHFADGSGTARLCVGKATLVDSSNAKWDLATEFANNALQIAVPADVLARAHYPIAIDPAIMPEFGIDNYLVPSAPNEFVPAVAHTSGQFLVVWDNPTNVVGARISEAGELLDLGGIYMSTNPYNRQFASVAGTPGGYLVVWVDFRNSAANGADIFGTRVSTAGAVLDPNGIAISTTTALENLPDVANNGNESLVVWQGNNQIFGARVRNDGVVLDSPGVQISSLGGQVFPAVACSGSDYLVVWEHLPPGQTASDIRGARVSLANVPGPEFTISAAVNNERTPAVASIAPDYFVVWEDNRIGPDPDVFGARVTAAGVSAPIEVSRVVGGQFAPAITANGNNYFVVWQDSRFFTTQKFDVYGARVDATGTVLDPGGFQITTSPNRETAPAVAAGAGNYLVAWQEELKGDIRATFVSFGGAVSDHNGMVLTRAFPSQLSPALAFNGSEFLVAWMDYRNSIGFDSNIVFGARLNSTGQLLGSAGLLISRAASYKQAIDIAANPNQFLVVWEDRRADGITGDIFGCRVAGGVVLDTNGIPINTAAGHQTSCAVAGDGTDFMAVWDSGGVITGSRVAQNGSVTDPGGIVIGGGGSPDVAFGGGNYFVVWHDNQPLRHIRGARVNNGTVLDPSGIPINSTATLQRYPRIAFNGTQFLVVWQDERNSATTFTDIYSTLVDTAGTVLSATGVNLTGASYQRFPAVAAGPQDFLAIWNDASNSATTGIDIAGGRVRGGTGVAADGTGFTIQNNPGDPIGYNVAYAGGGNYLVVYDTLINGVRRIMGRFVSGPPPNNPIPGLFNTGVDNLGRALADNTQDPHYTSTLVRFNLTGPTYAATSAQGFPIPPWIGDSPISAWISPTTDTIAAGGPRFTFSYKTTFDLTGYDPGTAVIVGQWATDNEGIDILINGQSTGQGNTAQFASYTPFRISSGFISGINTLAFIVNNADGPGNNPTGLRVEMDGSVAFLSKPIVRSIVWQNRQVVLTWEGHPGWEYIIQYNDDPSLSPERWQDLARVRAETAIVTYTDETAAEHRQLIYRIVAR